MRGFQYAEVSGVCSFLSMFYYMTDVGHFQLLYFYLWQIFYIFTSITNGRIPKLYTPICTEFFSCHVPTRIAYYVTMVQGLSKCPKCVNVRDASVSDTHTGYTQSLPLSQIIISVCVNVSIASVVHVVSMSVLHGLQVGGTKWQEVLALQILLDVTNALILEIMRFSNMIYIIWWLNKCPDL
jgi:hypothetical protein